MVNHKTTVFDPVLMTSVHKHVLSVAKSRLACSASVGEDMCRGVSYGTCLCYAMLLGYLSVVVHIVYNISHHREIVSMTFMRGTDRPCSSAQWASLS